MTFNQFKTIAEYFRKDVRVYEHGSFCTNKSKNTLGVVFVKNGKESRVYDYAGSYQQVLFKLGIEVYTTCDLFNANDYLERLKKDHGKKRGDDKWFAAFLSDEEKEEVIDYSKEIEEQEKLIEKMENNLLEDLYEKAKAGMEADK